MTVADSADLRYGRTEMTVSDTNADTDELRVVANTDSACSGGVGDYPCHHYAAGANITVKVTSVTDGSDLIDPFWTVALVKSNQDVQGDYSQNQSEVIDQDGFGVTSNITDGDTTTMSADGVEAGLYRLVLAAGDSEASSVNINDVDTSSTSGDYHYDTDGNTAEGGARSGSFTIIDAGVVFGTIELESESLSPTEQEYTDVAEQVVEFSPFGDGSAEFADAQAFGLDVADPTDGSTFKSVFGTPAVNAPGDTGTFASTQTYNIDTDLPQSASPVDVVVGLGATGGTNGVADPVEPALDIGSEAIDNLAATRQSWTVFRGTPPAGQKVDAVDGEWYSAVKFTDAATLGHGFSPTSVTRGTTPTAEESGVQLYNRNEAVDIDIEVAGVFDSTIDPDDTTVEVHDLNDQTEFTTGQQNSGPYTVAYTIAASDTADYDTAGSPKHVQINGGHYGTNDPTLDFDAAGSYPDGSFPHRVSRKLLVGAGTADADGNSLTVTTDEELYNRGESATLDYNVSFARGDATGDRDIASTVVSAADVTEDTTTLTPSADGAVTHVYTIDETDAATPDMAGSPKRVDAGDTLGNTADPSQEEYAVSRAFQHSTVSGSISSPNEILTGTAPSPTSDETTVRNRGEELFFTTVLHNARGEPLNGEQIEFNVREIDASTYEDTDQTATLTAGTLSGSVAGYTIDADAPATERALVAADTTPSANNQPPTGTHGAGNYAETTRTAPGAEYEVSDEYLVETRLQTDNTLDETAAETTSFIIASDVIQTFAEVTNQSGNPKADVPIDFTQYAPTGDDRQSHVGATGAGGWTDNQPFDTRAPAQSGWTLESTLQSAVEGNTAIDQQSFTMVSPFAADITPTILFGPTVGVANSDTGETPDEDGLGAIPGDRIKVKLGIMQKGARAAPDPSFHPQVLLARFNQDTGRLEVLQTDGTFRDKTESAYSLQWFDLKVTLETDDNGDPLQYLTNFGTQAQGVDSSNGYRMDTATWDKGGLVVASRFEYDNKRFNFADPFTFGHRATNEDIGHVFDGADFAAGFPSK